MREGVGLDKPGSDVVAFFEVAGPEQGGGIRLLCDKSLEVGQLARDGGAQDLG